MREFDAVLDAFIAEAMQPFVRQAARARLRATLASLPWRVYWPSWRRWGGFIAVRTDIVRERYGLTVPFGWCAVRDPWANLTLVMPWWLYPVWRLWRSR